MGGGVIHYRLRYTTTTSLFFIASKEITEKEAFFKYAIITAVSFKQQINRQDHSPDCTLDHSIQADHLRSVSDKSLQDRKDQSLLPLA